MSLLFSILIVSLGLFIKNSKLIYRIHFLWIWILTAFNIGGPDYKGYKELYQLWGKNIHFTLLKEGRIYATIAHYFSKYNLSFEIFNFFISTILLLILYKIIVKYSKNISFVSSCLVIYPLVDNIIQKRNFGAIIWVIVGFFILVYSKKYVVIKYITSILLAYGFHVIGIIYLPLIIIRYLKLEKIKKISYIGTIIITIMIGIIDKIAFLLFPSVKNKVELYFENMSMRLPLYKVSFFIIIHIVMFLLIYYFFKTLKIKDKFSIYAMKINYLMLTVIPLYYYNATFLRIYRNIFIINYIFIGSYLYRQRNKKLVSYIFILYIIGMFLTYVLLGEYKYSGLVAPLFEKNLILQWWY